MTFCATVNAIVHAGATPVLADVDPATMNIDPEAIAAKHHAPHAGDPAGPFRRAALRHGRDRWRIVDRAWTHVIEDCAHAIETEYRGRKAGTIGDFGCFSFYVTKNMVTGEGGMVLAHESAPRGSRSWRCTA